MYSFVMPVRSAEEVLSRIVKVWPTVCERYASQTGVVLAPSSDLIIDGNPPDMRVCLTINGHRHNGPIHAGWDAARYSSFIMLFDMDGDTWFEVHFEEDMRFLICLLDCLRENGPWYSHEQWCLSRAAELAYVRHHVRPITIFSMSADDIRDLSLLKSLQLPQPKQRVIEALWDKITQQTLTCFSPFAGHEWLPYGYDGLLCSDSANVWIYSDHRFWFGEIHCDADSGLRRVNCWLVVEIEDNVAHGSAFLPTLLTVHGYRVKAAAEIDFVLEAIQNASSPDPVLVALKCRALGIAVPSQLPDDAKDDIEADPYACLGNVTQMKSYYSDYSPQTAPLILDAISPAYEDYYRNGGVFGPALVAQYCVAGIRPATVGKYLKAFWHAGLKEIPSERGPIPIPYRPRSGRSTK